MVLWFGRGEFEGMGGGYSMVDGVIYDGDGEELPYPYYALCLMPLPCYLLLFAPNTNIML